MGLLSRFPLMMQGQGGAFGQPTMQDIPGVTPFAPNMPPEGQGQGPAFSMSPPNKPQPQQRSGWAELTGQQQPGASWNDRINGTLDSPLWNFGINMLAGSQQNGGDWGVVAQGMNQYQQQRMQRQQLQNQERLAKAQEGREQSAFGRQQTEWGRADQQRTAWEAAVNGEQDPQRQAMLRALGPQGYGEYMGNQEEMTWRSRESQLDRENQIRAAGIASAARNDPRDRIQYQSDLRRLAGMGEAANFANTAVLPRLRRAREIVAELSRIGGMDNPLSADRRIQLSQLGQFGAPARGLLQELRRIQTEFTVEDARALAPVSNTDFGRLQEINVNGNMTVDAAYRILEQMEQEVTRGVDNYTAAVQWTDRHEGLTGTMDPQGRTFEQSQYQAMQNVPPASGGSGAQTTTPAPTPTAPPRRGEVVDGYRFMGGNPSDRRNWVRVNDPNRRPDGPQRRG